MYMSNYLISISKHANTDDIIHDVKSKLKVKAFNPLKSTFTPNKHEVQFFVTDGNKKLAFETQGYKKHRKLLILHMISWYCVYLGLLEARIHPHWP